MKKALRYRVTAFLLILVMSLTFVPDMRVKAAEDYRGWSQADSRWAGIRLGGSSYTVKSSGCLATSMTKLVVQAGLKDQESFNVGTMVKLLNKNGGFTGSGLFCWDVAPKCIDGLSYKGNLLNYSSYSSKSYNDKLLNWIKSGYHLVIAVKYAGHWVAVDEAKSLETGEIYIMDSASSTVSKNMDITLADTYATFNRVVAYKGGETAKAEKEEPKTEAVEETEEIEVSEKTEDVEVAVSDLISPEDEVETAIEVGKTYTVGNFHYEVTEVLPEGGGSVTLTGTKKSKKALKTLKVKAAVTIEGQKFTITKVGDKAFQGYKKLTSVTIGKNIEEIGKQAFYKCSKLKNVTIKSSVLKKVGKNAMKKIHKKVSYSFPKGKKTTYKKLFS